MFKGLFSKQNNKDPSYPYIEQVFFKGRKLILICNQAMNKSLQPSADEFQLEYQGSAITVHAAFLQQFIHEDKASLVLATECNWQNAQRVRIKYSPLIQGVQNAEGKVLKPFDQNFILAAAAHNEAQFQIIDLHLEESTVTSSSIQQTTNSTIDLNEQQEIVVEAVIDDPVLQTTTAQNLAAEITIDEVSVSIDSSSYSPIEYGDFQPKMHLENVQPPHENENENENTNSDAASTAQLTADTEKTSVMASELQQALDAMLKTAKENTHLYKASDTASQNRKQLLREAQVKALIQEKLQKSSLAQEQQTQDVAKVLEQNIADTEAFIALANTSEDIASSTATTQQQETLQATHLKQQLLHEVQVKAHIQEKLQQSSLAQEQQTQAVAKVLEQNIADTEAFITSANTSADIASSTATTQQQETLQAAHLKQQLLNEAQVKTHIQAQLQKSSLAQEQQTQVVTKVLEQNILEVESQISLARRASKEQEVIDTAVQPAHREENTTDEPLSAANDTYNQTTLSLRRESKRLVVTGINHLDWKRQPKLSDFEILHMHNKLVPLSIYTTKKSLKDQPILVFIFKDMIPPNGIIYLKYNGDENSLKHEQKTEKIEPFTLSTSTIDTQQQSSVLEQAYKQSTSKQTDKSLSPDTPHKPSLFKRFLKKT